MAMTGTADDVPRRDYPDDRPLGFSSNFWFWAILAGGFIAYIPVYGAVKDGWYQGGLSLIVMAAAVYLMYHLPKIQVHRVLLRKAHWVALCAVMYFALGAGHSLLRWEFYSSEWRGNYDRLIEVYAKEKGITLSKDVATGVMQVPADQVADWRKRYERAQKVGPKPRYLDFEWQIKAYLFQWPWSFLHWVIWDWLLEIFNMIYNLLGTTYDWISARYTRGTQ